MKAFDKNVCGELDICGTLECLETRIKPMYNKKYYFLGKIEHDYKRVRNVV